MPSSTSAPSAHRRIDHIDRGRPGDAADTKRPCAATVSRANPRLTARPQPRRRAAARALIDTPARQRPTAVTVFNDRCATGVLDALHRAGLTIPRDISVVGDDSRLARISREPRRRRSGRRADERHHPHRPGGRGAARGRRPALPRPTQDRLLGPHGRRGRGCGRRSRVVGLGCIGSTTVWRSFCRHRV